MTTLWLNGPFGIGKTTTAMLLVEASGYACFDPEQIGFVVRDVASYSSDLQDLRSWQLGVPAVLEGLVDDVDTPIVMPMTVYRPEIREGVRSALRARAVDVVEVTLVASSEELERRLRGREQDPGARDWALEHLGASLRAFREDAGDLLIDTTDRSPAEIIEQVLAFVQGREAGGAAER